MKLFKTIPIIDEGLDGKDKIVGYKRVFKENVVAIVVVIGCLLLALILAL